MSTRPLVSRLSLCLILGVLSAAQAGQPGSDQLLESRLLKDAADGELDSFSLWDASLIAGGIDHGRDLVSYDALLESFCEHLQSEDSLTADDGDRARRVLAYLHKEILSGRYSAACTELHQTLDSGDYNCVTATIAYNSLCRQLQLPVSVISEPGHVFSRHPGQPPIDVQTTSPSGYGKHLPEVRSLQLVSGQSVRRAINAAVDQREITDVQLIAKIYYNRGVTLLEKGQFAEALQRLELACQLDQQDQVAANNVLACINNWALDLSDQGEYEQASAMLVEGLARSETYTPFWENDLHVHHCWISSLVEQGKYEEALSVLNGGFDRRPDAPLFREGRAIVYRMWIASLRQTHDQEALRQVTGAARRDFPRQSW